MEELSPEKREVQKPKDGEGPLYHRRYEVTFASTPEKVTNAMKELVLDLNRFSPQWLAAFKKTKGTEGTLQVGDEFDVKLSAPWKAPVRVSEITDRSFSLLTLDGHLEAGKICFTIDQLERGLFRFRIESVARSRDKLVDFLYDKIPICRAAQREMWEEFCLCFAQKAGAEDQDPDIDTITERRDESSGRWERV